MSMMKTKKNFPGKDGFVWWTGIVEGRKDPLKTHRVQVRIFGWHSDKKSMISSEELLWAQPIMASNAYDRTCVPKEGEVLFGFFMDGEDAQFPFYIGVIPNIPVLEMRKDIDETTQILQRLINEKIKMQEGDVFILGCLALWGLGKKFRSCLGLPILDGAEASLKMAELVVKMGLKHSRITYPKK